MSDILNYKNNYKNLFKNLNFYSFFVYLFKFYEK